MRGTLSVHLMENSSTQKGSGSSFVEVLGHSESPSVFSSRSPNKGRSIWIPNSKGLEMILHDDKCSYQILGKAQLGVDPAPIRTKCWSSMWERKTPKPLFFDRRCARFTPRSWEETVPTTAKFHFSSPVGRLVLGNSFAISSGCFTDKKGWGWGGIIV